MLTLNTNGRGQSCLNLLKVFRVSYTDLLGRSEEIAPTVDGRAFVYLRFRGFSAQLK